MITGSEVVPMLLVACPGFQATVNEHRAFYEEEILYGLLDDFACYLLKQHQSGHIEEFGAVIGVIERLIVEGDHYVREAATIGLLEGIQNFWARGNEDPETFGRLLLPESRRWWDEVNAFWNGERHFVGEGLQKQMTVEDVAQVHQDIRAFNERLRREREEKEM